MNFCWYKKFSEAKIELLRAVDLKGNYWKDYEALASHYYKTEQYSQSVNTYEMVTRSTPDSAVGFARLGSAYWMMGEIKLALRVYANSL